MRFSNEDVVLPRQGGRAAWSTMPNCLDESAAGVTSTTKLQIDLQTLDMVGSRASCPTHLVRPLDMPEADRTAKHSPPISHCSTPRLLQAQNTPRKKQFDHVTSTIWVRQKLTYPALAPVAPALARTNAFPYWLTLN